MATLSEDDIYRMSTQYRLWSFSPEKLAALRQQTHELAVKRGAQLQVSKIESAGSHDVIDERDELRLIQRYCEQIRTTSDHFKFPPAVKATAVQFLKRFYLSNSVLTYPPKEIYKTILFLACKSEGTHLPLSEYARRISTDRDVILAPEYKVMQALRFTLDVKQPFRGLKGVLMEQLNMVANEDIGGSSEGLLSVPLPKGRARTPWKGSKNDSLSSKDVQDRVQDAYKTARGLLDAPCLLTDVYFLYTPSQILLACLHLADPPLLEYYLSSKIPPDAPERARVFATIQECSEIIGSFSSEEIMSKDERNTLEDRLEKCRDPSTKDIVKAHMAAKRGDEEEDADKIQKRRTERENHMREGDELFGPTIPTANGTSER